MTDSILLKVDNEPRAYPNRYGRGNICEQCGKVWSWLFMVKNEVWRQVQSPQDFVCLACFEKNLGRHIKLSDLYECGITTEMYLGIYLYIRGGECVEFQPDFLQDY